MKKEQDQKKIMRKKRLVARRKVYRQRTIEIHVDVDNLVEQEALKLEISPTAVIRKILRDHYSKQLKSK
jgi:hypothetical protein